MDKKVIAMAALFIALASEGAVASADPRPLPAAGARFHDCANCPEMIIIPAGSFTMGSPKSEQGRFDNEGPQHPVTIARPFAMGVYDVTVGEYRRFVNATGQATSEDCRVYDPAFIEPQLVRVRGKNWKKPNFAQTDRNPVVCVTFDDARAYVEWLNSQVGLSSSSARALGVSGPYRLPTEAEWEYAARAGTTTPFYWGTAMRRSDANYGPDELRFAPVAKGADRWEYTSPVGSFPANAFGLFDMAGNAWNFTQDCWHPDYAGAPDNGSARTDGPCNARVVRGGSWFKPPAGERSAKRGEGKVADLRGNAEIGFRVVRDLDPR